MASYIVNAAGTELIAVTEKNMPSGMAVQYAWEKCNESIDAAREFNLVNASNGKISNAKKWAEIERRNGFEVRATEINDREFFLD